MRSCRSIALNIALMLSLSTAPGCGGDDEEDSSESSDETSRSPTGPDSGVASSSGGPLDGLGALLGDGGINSILGLLGDGGINSIAGLLGDGGISGIAGLLGDGGIGDILSGLGGLLGDAGAGLLSPDGGLDCSGPLSILCVDGGFVIPGLDAGVPDEGSDTDAETGPEADAGEDGEDAGNDGEDAGNDGEDAGTGDS